MLMGMLLVLQVSYHKPNYQSEIMSSDAATYYNSF